MNSNEHKLYNRTKELQKKPHILRGKVLFVDTLSRKTNLWDRAVPCGSQSSHSVVQLNPDEDKVIFSHHILHLCHHQRKFHQRESELLLETQKQIHNHCVYTLDQIYNIKYAHTTFKIFLQKRQSLEQILRKLAETAEFSDIYTQEYS